MSLVNKMLRDLDARHAGDGDRAALPAAVTPLAARQGPRGLPWAWFGTVLVAAVLGVAAWYVTRKPDVPAALPVAAAPPVPAGPVTPAAPIAPVDPVAPAASPAPAASVAPARQARTGAPAPLAKAVLPSLRMADKLQPLSPCARRWRRNWPPPVPPRPAHRW